ncbi:enoyl-CoA hydratase/isomerase family protein [Sphingobium chlorophenolicum]|uniref:Enoyl-CoA hydratase/isomerase n=1 Tax=Sphingobium chlorophenolicum TaxID=46429 RepID=A0A081RGX1_SPHCR|nr:enoyl-CoA hydratase-related protein [Sphingobium chlorophenolicum]KEQ54444.1 Enoyl-CoA hydratase/isomerase [Sphingobium chlorophenolicum]
MVDDDILVERLAGRDGIVLVTLNRPARLNALLRETVAHFNAVLDELAADAACRAVIITGAGRGFCSGQDLAASNQRNQAGSSGVIEKLYWQQQFAGMGGRIRSMPKLVIAAVNGPAVGAGMAIALSADVRIATPAAKFLVAAVRIGLTGGESGISYLLPRMIGAARAFDILLTGRAIEAEEAERFGLVRALSQPGSLIDDAVAYARSVLANSPYSVAHTKALMWSNLDANSYEAAIQAENRTQILGTMTEDYGEATAAFMEKRPPHYSGR